MRTETYGAANEICNPAVFVCHCFWCANNCSCGRRDTKIRYYCRLSGIGRGTNASEVHAGRAGRTRLTCKTMAAIQAIRCFTLHSNNNKPGGQGQLHRIPYMLASSNGRAKNPDKPAGAYPDDSEVGLGSALNRAIIQQIDGCRASAVMRVRP